MADTLPPKNPDEALAFFRDVVEPTVAEFMHDLSNKRLGCLACLAVASMTEHYFHGRLQDSEGAKAAFKAQVHRENRAVRWVADVANATRYVQVSNHGRIGYSDVRVKNTAQCGVFRAGWQLGGGEEVLVGSEHEWRLSAFLREALSFWKQRLGLDD